jgi:transposase-like protein
MLLSWNDVKNMVVTMYLSGHGVEEIMKTFEITHTELKEILDDEGIPPRTKSYSDYWFYCPHCRKRIFKTYAVEKRGKQLKRYYCQFCGRRLRWRPKNRGRKK